MWSRVCIVLLVGAGHSEPFALGPHCWFTTSRGEAPGHLANCPRSQVQTQLVLPRALAPAPTCIPGPEPFWSTAAPPLSCSKPPQLP